MPVLAAHWKQDVLQCESAANDKHDGAEHVVTLYHKLNDKPCNLRYDLSRNL